MRSITPPGWDAGSYNFPVNSGGPSEDFRRKNAINANKSLPFEFLIIHFVYVV
jgi:hypothetical protein